MEILCLLLLTGLIKTPKKRNPSFLTSLFRILAKMITFRSREIVFVGGGVIKIQ